MVTTGFSKPYVAKYAATGQSVTYSGGLKLGRGVSLSLEIETADDNNFHADNVLAETESSNFTSGTATITVDGLDNDAATLILGLGSPQSLQVDETSVQMQGYGQAMQAPYVGFGCIRRTQMQGMVQYWPYILPKVKPLCPDGTAKRRRTTVPTATAPSLMRYGSTGCPMAVLTPGQRASQTG